MKNLQARIEDKLRIVSNLLAYSLYKTRILSTKEPSLNNVRNILVIELKRIGDILVATPTIRVLKENFPQANIDIVVLPGMEEVLYGNKNIHHIFAWDRSKIKENYPVYLQQIKDKYDLSVILHNGTYEVSKLLKDAKVPYRIGCTRVGFREPKGYFLTKQLLPDTKLKHKIEDNLDVLKLININNIKDKSPEAYTTRKAELAIKKILQENEVSDKALIIVLHTVSWTHPTWLKERFAELSDKLVERYKAKIIFVGTEKEKYFIEEIMLLMKSKSLNLAGKTSIQELFALIKRAKLVIGIDSASTNIAAAFKTPVIALFGAGDKTIWSPFSKNSISIQKDEVCTACMKSECKYKNHRHLECMKAITVEEVLNAVKNLGFTPPAKYK
ncbi:glycosyltransferase family 9 protein [Candidatus Woesearchaeota archaeon]|nr:glycosyltransferase family 9 protein [Candidatus Woesearchaeota archaeon]